MKPLKTAYLKFYQKEQSTEIYLTSENGNMKMVDFDVSKNFIQESNKIEPVRRNWKI